MIPGGSRLEKGIDGADKSEIKSILKKDGKKRGRGRDGITFRVVGGRSRTGVRKKLLTCLTGGRNGITSIPARRRDHGEQSK